MLRSGRNEPTPAPGSQVTVMIKAPLTEFLTSHSSLSKNRAGPLYHTVQSWHHMECGCRLEIESSGTHLSCWAQMHCSPHTVWLIATVHSHTNTHCTGCTCADKHCYVSLLLLLPIDNPSFSLPSLSASLLLSLTLSSDKRRPPSGPTTVRRMMPQRGGKRPPLREWHLSPCAAASVPFNHKQKCRTQKLW